MDRVHKIILLSGRDLDLTGETLVTSVGMMFQIYCDFRMGFEGRNHGCKLVWLFDHFVGSPFFDLGQYRIYWFSIRPAGILKDQAFNFLLVWMVDF